MGEEADYLIDQMMFPDYEFGFPSYERDRNRRWCRYCEEGNLHWVHTEAGWRLFNDDGEMHDCL